MNFSDDAITHDDDSEKVTPSSGPAGKNGADGRDGRDGADGNEEHEQKLEPWAKTIDEMNFWTTVVEARLLGVELLLEKLNAETVAAENKVLRTTAAEKATDEWSERFSADWPDNKPVADEVFKACKKDAEDSQQYLDSLRSELDSTQDLDSLRNELDSDQHFDSMEIEVEDFF